MQPKSYKEIFGKRGGSYDNAMDICKECRREEFISALRLAELQPGMRVLDIPSGGCYLEDFIDIDVDVVGVESVKDFYERCRQKGRDVVLVSDIFTLPFEQGKFDRVLSIAGIHHLTDEEKKTFYREMRRVIAPEGRFILADVYEHSPVARFLNEFVDRYNPMGHEGIFLHDNSVEQLRAAGFERVSGESISYYWVFENEDELYWFMTNLFGLENIGKEELIEGVRSYLGLERRGSKIMVYWELYFVVANTR